MLLVPAGKRAGRTHVLVCGVAIAAPAGYQRRVWPVYAPLLRLKTQKARAGTRAFVGMETGLCGVGQQVVHRLPGLEFMPVGGFLAADPVGSPRHRVQALR